MDPRLDALRRAKARPNSINKEELERYEAGGGDLALAIRFGEEDFRALRDRALACYEAGRIDDARILLEALVVLGDEAPAVCLVLAGAYAELGEYARAHETLQAALASAKVTGDDDLLEAARTFEAHVLGLRLAEERRASMPGREPFIRSASALVRRSVVARSPSTEGRTT